MLDSCQLKLRQCTMLTELLVTIYHLKSNDLSLITECLDHCTVHLLSSNHVTMCLLEKDISEVLDLIPLLSVSPSPGPFSLSLHLLSPSLYLSIPWALLSPSPGPFSLSLHLLSPSLYLSIPWALLSPSPGPFISPSPGPIYYLSLNKVSANERRPYICNVFSDWLRPCSAIDRAHAGTQAALSPALCLKLPQPIPQPSSYHLYIVLHR